MKDIYNIYAGCDLHVVFFGGERARESRKHTKHDEKACCPVILRSGHNVRTPCNSWDSCRHPRSSLMKNGAVQAKWCSFSYRHPVSVVLDTNSLGGHISGTRPDRKNRRLMAHVTFNVVYHCTGHLTLRRQIKICINKNFKIMEFASRMPCYNMTLMSCCLLARIWRQKQHDIQM